MGTSLDSLKTRGVSIQHCAFSFAEQVELTQLDQMPIPGRHSDPQGPVDEKAIGLGPDSGVWKQVGLRGLMVEPFGTIGFEGACSPCV